MGIHDLKYKAQLGHLVGLARFKLGVGVEFLLVFRPGSKRPCLLSEWHQAVAMLGFVSFQGFIMRIPHLLIINNEAWLADHGCSGSRRAARFDILLLVLTLFHSEMTQLRWGCTMPAGRI